MAIESNGMIEELTTEYQLHDSCKLILESMI